MFCTFGVFLDTTSCTIMYEINNIIILDNYNLLVVMCHFRQSFAFYRSDLFRTSTFTQVVLIPVKHDFTLQRLECSCSPKHISCEWAMVCEGSLASS